MKGLLMGVLIYLILGSLYIIGYYALERHKRHYDNQLEEQNRQIEEEFAQDMKNQGYITHNKSTPREWVKK